MLGRWVGVNVSFLSRVVLLLELAFFFSRFDLSICNSFIPSIIHFLSMHPIFSVPRVPTPPFNKEKKNEIPRQGTLIKSLIKYQALSTHKSSFDGKRVEKR